MSLEFITNGSTPEQRIASGDVVLARELISKDAIEQEAMDLVNMHELQVLQGPLTNERKDNAVTGLFERITAAGDLSEVSFKGDQSAIHKATRQRILNSLTQDMPSWDKKRYFYELCEELTVAKVFDLIKTGSLPPDTKVITHSDFPDDMASPNEKHDRGYRTLNNKGMLRSYHFEKDQDGEWVRVLEQLSRSDSNDGSTREWFNQNASAVPLHSTGALAEQFLVTAQRLPDGVISLAAELDGIFGTVRLYGESSGDAVSRPGYDTVRQSSRLWRDQLQHYTDELTEYEDYLHSLRVSKKISYDRHLRLFHEKIDTIIQRVLLLAPQFAEDTYGTKAAPYIYEASLAFAAGHYSQATAFLETAETHKDERASTGCGGRGAEKDPLSPKQSPGEAVDEAITDKKDWKWKQGICAVKSCPTRPGKTVVGPCSVCTSCQHKFDQGKDPTKEKPQKLETKDSEDLEFAVLALFKATKEQFATAA